MTQQRSTACAHVFSSSLHESQVFVKHLREGVSHKASLWLLQLHLLLVFFISPLPELVITQFLEENLPQLRGEGDMCVDSVCSGRPLSLLQTLDQQPAQALPAVPAAGHHPADPPDACSRLTLPEDAAQDLPVALRHPDLSCCLLPLWGDRLCWHLLVLVLFLVLVFGSDSGSWLKKRHFIISLQQMLTTIKHDLKHKKKHPGQSAHSPSLSVLFCRWSYNRDSAASRPAPPGSCCPRSPRRGGCCPEPLWTGACWFWER